MDKIKSAITALKGLEGVAIPFNLCKAITPLIHGLEAFVEQEEERKEEEDRENEHPLA